MSDDTRFGDWKLADLPLFSGLEGSALGAIAERLEVHWYAAGSDLFCQGEEADALYVLLSGALAILREKPGEPSTWVGQALAGETVGEMALLSGKPRSATVRAQRDSEVLRFKKSDFEALMTVEAAAMLQIARVAFQRLEAAMAQAPRARFGRTFALVPATPETDVRAFGDDLAAALARYGRVGIVRKADGEHMSSAWFHQQEQQHDFLLYLAEASAGPWFELCHRQSDEALQLVNSKFEPEALARITRKPDPLKRIRVVLLHGGAVRAGRTQPWRDHFSGALHCHVRDIEDIRRLARVLTGHATGLVLSGGGARGFAHLGVVRALREHGLQIDQIGGTSIGAIMGAGVAMEWSDEELYQRYHRCFVATNPLGHFTIPFIALVAGRKTTSLMKREFAATQIEDLPLPFYCVSANLTRGTINEHHDGPLWRALRATVAIPGILPPVFANGEVLVDGGVINNLPVDVMRRELHGSVIGVDIAGDHAITAGVEEADLPALWRMAQDWFRGHRPRPTILQILLRSGMVNSASSAEQNRKNSTLMLKPPVEGVELLDWQAFDRAINIGYRYTRDLLDSGIELK